MKKIIIATLSAIAVLTACDKAFEVEDTSRLTGSSVAAIVEQDPEFLSSYVSGLYTYMVKFANTYTGHDDYGYLSVMMISDFMGQDIAMSKGSHYGIYDYQHDYGGAQYVRCRQIWATFFTLINNANAIIDFFQEEDPVNPVLRGYLGQAYAIRALSYTCLLYFFQDPINADGSIATDKPSVPIIFATRDGKSEDEKAAKGGRCPISDIMEHIEFNIEKALPLLEGYTRSTKNEIDYSVGQGIAARYYLFAQKWDKAAEAASKAREGYVLMDQARLGQGFNEILDNEVMWGFDHTSETSTIYASFFSHMSPYYPGYASILYKCIDADLYSKMQNSDYRKALFNGPEGNPDGASPVLQFPYVALKFGAAPNWLGDYIYMRAAEMYLIEAEACARGNKPADANKALSALMAQRDPAWSKTATVDEVLLQRRLELWGEGFSTLDLIRNGLGAKRKYEGTNHPSSNQVDYPAHDPLWFFQVPLSEIDSNPYITEDDQTPLS